MKKSLLIAIVLITISSSVFAGRIWHYTTISPNVYESSAIALRNGQAWPTVVAGNSNIGTFAQTPLGWLEGPVVDRSGFYIRGASNSSGQAAFVTPSSVVTLDNSGWGSHAVGGLDVAFNGSGQVSIVQAGGISTFDGLNWNQSSWADDGIGLIGGSIAYDTYGQANVLAYDSSVLYYGIQGNLTSDQWMFGQVVQMGGNVRGDLALTTNDVPVIAFSDNSTSLNIASYDIQENEWDFSLVSDNLAMAHSFVIDSDSKGGVGLAYIDGHGNVNYSHYDGASWSTAEILADAAINGTIGLDFDYEDNPVISYTGHNPEDNSTGLIIAYDPIITPEPVTIGMLSIGGLLIARRR